MLGSSAGAGPGAQGLPGGRRNGGPAEATRTTDLDRAMIVRANVPGSGSGWRGAHSVWGGPCVGPRAHTKWASQVRPLLGPQGDLVTRAVSRAQGRSALEACARLPTGPLRARGPSLAAAGRARPAYIGRGVCVSVRVSRWMDRCRGGMRVHMHIYIWMDGWVSAYPHGWMPPAGHAGIRRGRRPWRARAGQLVTSGASRVRLGVSRPGVGPWRAPANWSPPVPASVSLGQRLSMARALACRRPACPRGSRQLVTLPPARAAPPAAPTRPANWPPRARLRASPSSSSSPSSPSSPSLRRPRARAYRAPSPPQPTPLNRDPRARRRRPFSYTYPPTSPGPSSCAQTFPGPAARGSPRPSRPANWRESMEVEIPRGPAVTGAPPRLRRKVSGPPSKRPALPGPLMGGYLTAYTTRLVTSVVCRGFIPARGDIAIRQPAPGGFSPGAVASLLRYMARRPIRIQLRRAGLHRRVPARILT
ncbi:hypothetical protein KXW64_006589 [Aspergillus fumigatus]|nr:hypothetical protein KXW64_006589 [Aspergillus fumigatus]